MTLEGTVVKTAGLLMILMATAVYTWFQAMAGSPLTYGLLMIGLIGGFVTADLDDFHAQGVSVLCAGLCRAGRAGPGPISAIFEARYHGIAFKAVGLSVGVLATMLFVYGTGIIRVTEKFKIGVVAATGAICLVYVVDIVASFLERTFPYIHESGYFGIGFSLVVVVIAALNLVLDFDFISDGVQMQAPKYMEWYGGFSLLVTLVWMYLEILRLLAKLQGGSRN